MLASKACELRWACITEAVVTLDGERVRLERDGKQLVMSAPAGCTWQTFPLTPPRDFESPNEGCTMLGFVTRLGPEQERILTVTLTPQTP